MSEHNTNICPCCPRGCNLDSPHCSRGEEYLRTGITPEKGTHDHHHGGHHHHDYEKMGIDEKLFMLLGRLGRMGHGAFDGKSSQNRILHILSKTESMTQRELTERLGIRPGSASEIIKKLESAGLIVRQSSIEDRRTADIALTDAGKARVEENPSRFDHTNRVLFECLSEEEKQQLLILLEKLARDWHTRFRGEGRPDRGHHKNGGHKGGHDEDHGHSRDHRQAHGHHHSLF